jgi:hypothetical protein
MKIGYLESSKFLAVETPVYTIETKEEKGLLEKIFCGIAEQYSSCDLHNARGCIVTGLDDILLYKDGEYKAFEYEKTDSQKTDLKVIKVLLTVFELIDKCKEAKFLYESQRDFSLKLSFENESIMFETFEEKVKLKESFAFCSDLYTEAYPEDGDTDSIVKTGFRVSKVAGM